MKPTPLTDAILSQPEASKLTFAQRSDLRAIESDRAELIEALRHNLKLFDLLAKESPSRNDDNFAGYVFSADKIRALLSRLGAE